MPFFMPSAFLTYSRPRFHRSGITGEKCGFSSKKPELENKAELIQRLEMATRYKGKDRLALSPQCGFASTMEGNLLTEVDQEAKLCLVSAVAKETWT